MNKFTNFNLPNFRFWNLPYRSHHITPVAYRNDTSVTLTFPDIEDLVIHNKSDCPLF